MSEYYERATGSVKWFDPRSGEAMLDLGDMCAPLHAAAFIGGPMRLPRKGDKVIVSLDGNRTPVSAQICTHNGLYAEASA